MSERSEQRCFEIMNMNDKTFIFSPDAPSGFFSGKNFFLQNFQRKNFSKFFFKNFFLQNFQRKKFFKIFFHNFFLQNFQRKKIFHNFFLQNFQRNIFSASPSGTQELNLSGYPFHLTKAFFFFWSRRITFSIRKIF